MAVLALLHVALNVAGVAGGVLAGRRSIRLAAALSCTALAVVATRFAIAHVPAAEARLLPWDWYPFLEPWWFHPFVCFMIGAPLAAAWNSVWKRDVLLIFAGLFLLRVGGVVWSNVAPWSLPGRVDARGICAQTTPWSCAPAAAAAFLHRFGIEATEDEMARLCATRAGLFGGTSDAGILRGLRHKGLRAEIVPEMRAPSMVSIELTALVSHALVLEEIQGDAVVVVDPLGGRRRQMPRAEFERVWRRTSIVASR